MTDEKKNIFDKIGDALTNRDEKEAAAAAAVEAAKKDAEAKRKAAAEKLQKDAKARAEERARLAAEKKVKADAEAKAKLEVAQAKQKETQERIQKEFAEKQAARAAEFKTNQEAAEKAKYVKHVWTNEDTYASLAFKHYGSIQEPYWRLIYNHNKAIIGDHPNNIRTGLEIEIPPLPDELKKK